MKCSIPDCDRDSKAKGWCKMHYDRFRATGDPLRKSRFDTPEEKAAFIVKDRAERRARREARRAEEQARLEGLRLLQTRAVKNIGPTAEEMVAAIDELDPAERAAVVSLCVSLLLGYAVDIRL